MALTTSQRIANYRGCTERELTPAQKRRVRHKHNQASTGVKPMLRRRAHEDVKRADAKRRRTIRALVAIGRARGVIR